LAGAVLGYQSFATKLPGATTIVPYVIFDGAGNWETGIGLYTLSGTTLARTAQFVIDGTNGRGVLVSLQAGATVMLDQPSTNVADVGFAINLAACQVMQ
jgi:hypothetical protein